MKYHNGYGGFFVFPCPHCKSKIVWFVDPHQAPYDNTHKEVDHLGHSFPFCAWFKETDTEHIAYEMAKVIAKDVVLEN